MATISAYSRLLPVMRRWFEPALLLVTVSLLAAGGVAWAVGAHPSADVLWAAGTVVAVVPAIGWVVAAIVRRTLGVDLIAVLALSGTLAVGEYLAGALIAVMLATVGHWSRPRSNARPGTYGPCSSERPVLLGDAWVTWCRRSRSTRSSSETWWLSARVRCCPSTGGLSAAPGGARRVRADR